MIEWGSVASWVSGVGSMSAAIAALYIAHSARRIRLRGFCGHRVIVEPGKAPVDVFSVAATNVSQRSTVISNIGCSFGVWRWKQQGIIRFMHDQYGPGIPKSLVDGETVVWSVPLGQDNKWLKDFTSKWRLTRWTVWTWRIHVYTSNGGTTTFRPDKSTRTMLLEAAGLRNVSDRSRKQP